MPVRNPDIDAPAGVPASYEDHVALMFDMLHLAFQTDSTRVATLLLAREGSNRRFNDIGILGPPRSHAPQEQRRDHREGEAHRSLVRAAPRDVPREDGETEDVDGKSLLHHSMILYGSGNADGNRHTHVNLPVVLAGAGGGAFKPGRYVKAKAAHHQPVPQHGRRHGREGVESHGDSTGAAEIV